MGRGGPGLLDATNAEGQTPLTLAVRHGRVDVFRHILDRCAART